MSDYLVVSATDSTFGPVLDMLGGRAISSRMGIIPWSGTVEQLHRRIAGRIPRIVLITSLTGDCLLFPV